MPALGRTADATEGGLVATGLQDSRAMDQFHRNREKERMNIPDEPEPISELSFEQRVYIYNVSPWRFQQDLASYGTRTIPALDEDKVLKGLFVAGPLVIEGLPKEYYPSEGEAKVIYHKPQKNRGRFSRRPGLDFANEVIGKGMMVNPSCNLEAFGVFVSEQVEQEKPEKGAPSAAVKAFDKWSSDVKAAQNMLRAKCAKMCEDANIEYARGKFGEIRNDQLYQAARIIEKTEVECKWLADTASAASREACGGCGRINSTGIIKCICGYRVCSDEVWQTVKDRYSNS